MDFALTTAQVELRDAARRFALAELPAIAADCEARNVPPSRDLVRRYGELGFLGINVPEGLGGLGLGNIEALLVLEQFAQISSAIAFPIFESSVGPVRAIERFGSDSLRRRIVPAVCAGEKIIAVAMSEAEAGSALSDLRTRGVEKLQFDHRLLKMKIEAFHVLGRARRKFRRRRLPAALRVEMRQMDFVGEDLHRLGEVQRSVSGIGRNVHQRMTTLQFLIAESGLFTPKHHGYGRGRACPHDFLRGGARLELRPAHAAQARAGADYEGAIGQRLVQCRATACPREQIVSAGRTRRRLRVGKLCRLHQHELLQAHVLHRPRGGADVARMAGMNQDDTDVAVHGRQQNQFAGVAATTNFTASGNSSRHAPLAACAPP